MLFSIVKDPLITANELNHDLDAISEWAHQWKLEFNPDPLKETVEIIFSCKRNPPIHPQIFFNGNVVAKVKEHEHLGLFLESKLSFKKHVTEKIKKAKQKIGTINIFLDIFP